MKLQILIALCIAIFQIQSFAADENEKTTSKTKISSHDRREISVAPGANYAEDTGWAYGTTVSYSHPISRRSQLEVGGIFFKYSDNDRAQTDESLNGIFAGPNFNFGQDFSSNYFAGVGAGYSNYLPFRTDPDRDRFRIWLRAIWQTLFVKL